MIIFFAPAHRIIILKIYQPYYCEIIVKKKKSVIGNYWRYFTNVDATAELFSECLTLTWYFGLP